jgi:hypothetical protein
VLVAATPESDPPAPRCGRFTVTHFEPFHLHITAAELYGGLVEFAVPTAQAPEPPGTGLIALM